MNSNVFQTISDLPFIHEGRFIDGIILKQNRTCLSKCREKDCLQFLNSGTNGQHYMCSKKYDNFLIHLNEFKYLINGLVLLTNRFIPKDRAGSRKEYIFTEQKIRTEIEKIQSIERAIAIQSKTSIEKNFGVFHDIKTSLGLVQNCVETYVNSQHGTDFQDKLSKSDRNIFDLYDALNFVNSQLGMIDVLVNSESITQGNKRRINFYRLFHRLNRLFTHKAAKKSVEIHWRDNGQVPDIEAYPSIEFVPIILLDNAVKYSSEGYDINILFETSKSRIKVTVSSFGPVVDVDERALIFQKYYRARNVRGKASTGIGLGLWLANEILIRHNSTIHYDGITKGQNGYNNFVVEIRI